MERNRSNNAVRMGTVVFLLCVIASIFYYQYFYKPKNILQTTLRAFETNIRTQNVDKLKTIVSKKSMTYNYLSSPDLLATIKKFHPGIEVISAQYTAGSNNRTIHGVAKMKAIVDETYREFGDLYIEKENNTWKIRQFGFQSYLNF